MCVCVSVYVCVSMKTDDVVVLRNQYEGLGIMEKIIKYNFNVNQILLLQSNLKIILGILLFQISYLYLGSDNIRVDMCGLQRSFSQGVSKLCPIGQAGPLPAFVNWNTAMIILLHSVYGSFHTKMVELSSCDREYMAHKAYICNIMDGTGGQQAK